MIANNSTEHDDARLFDALVDGELPESQRADLLRRLDQSPEGWRRLSLAFLEAQEWRLALRVPRTVSDVQPASVPIHRSRRAFAWWGAWAVSALLAFSLGLSANGLLRPATPDNSIAAGNSSPRTVPEVIAAPAGVQSAALARTLSPAAKQQLERLGFRVHERPRVVSIPQPDGHTVQVLVNEVELHFVGRQYSL